MRMPLVMYDMVYLRKTITPEAATEWLSIAARSSDLSNAETHALIQDFRHRYGEDAVKHVWRSRLQMG